MTVFTPIIPLPNIIFNFAGIATPTYPDMNGPVDIKFVEVDANAERTALQAIYEAGSGVKLENGSSEKIIIDTIAAFQVSAYQAINDAGRQNILNNAADAQLDGFGYGMASPRLDSVGCLCEVEFLFKNVVTGLQGALAYDAILPANLRITDGTAVFQLFYDYSVKAGETSKTVIVRAISDYSGTAYNGIAVGKITDYGNVPATGEKYALDFVYSFSNTTKTVGGQDYEGNAKYRERLKLADMRAAFIPPKEQYGYDILTNFPDIIDVNVSSTVGSITVCVLPFDFTNAAWTSSILTALLIPIQTFVEGDEYKFLNHTATVTFPTETTYSIAVSVTPLARIGSNLTDLTTKIQNAINGWAGMLASKLGQDIVPNQLKRQIMGIDGVYDVEVITPAKQKIAGNQIAIMSASTITFTPAEDE